MLRVVADANVLVSAALARSPQAPSALTLDAALDSRLELVTAPHLLQEIAAVLGYSPTRGPARLLVAVMAALADDQGVVEGVTTEQLCAAAGAADRTYRRAQATLLASGEVVLRSGSGGRGTRTAGRSRTRAPIAAPRGWHVAGGRAPAGGDDLDRELLRVECEQVAVSGDERVGTAGCCECDKVVVVRVAADGWVRARRIGDQLRLGGEVGDEPKRLCGGYALL